MLYEGQLLKHACQGHTKWVVVMVNECRAVIVPLNDRDPSDKLAVFSESDTGHINVSPNSLIEPIGRVSGVIKHREAILIHVVSPVAVERSRPAPTLKPVVVRAARPTAMEDLPGLPEDDDVVSQAISAARRSVDVTLAGAQ